MAALSLRRLYAPEHMIKDELKLGDIPGTAETYRVAFGVAWAAITETFLIALIGMADTIMVSSVGETAIAAVGLVNQPRFIVQSLIMSLNVAVTSICARRRGQNDQNGALCCLKQGLVLSLMISVLLSFIALFFARPLILFAGAQPDTVDMATSYFVILLYGLPLNNLSLTISAAQRGIGQTKASMNINMMANIVNLILNYLLIGGNFGFPRLGVEGAAIATVIGWGCGLLVAVYSVFHRDRFLHILSLDGWKLRRETLAPMYQVTAGSFGEQICMRVGFMTYSKIIAGLGTTMTATHFIVQNIMSLSFSFGEGFGIASSSLVGQNLGAKRPDLSIVFGKTCQRMALSAATMLFFIFSFTGRGMIRLFSADEEIIRVGSILLIVIGFIIFGQSSQMVFMGSLRGAGDTKYTAYISLVSIVMLRPVVAYFLAYKVGWGLVGAWLGFFVDQYLRLLLTYRRFSNGKWINIKL